MPLLKGKSSTVAYPQAPDTMLCLWVIVLMYEGLLAFCL